MQTVSSIQSFVLAMILYPEVQQAAQKEVDRIVGKDRLPDWSDQASLPYVTAVVKETFRYVLSRFTHAQPYGALLDGTLSLL